MRTTIIISFILGLVLVTACYKASDYDLNKLDESTVIKDITVSPDKIPADGVSHTVVSVSIPENADIITVNFKTSAGKFEADATSANAQKGLATLKLISGTKVDSLVVVEAEIAGVRKSQNVEFSRAYPQSIHMDISQFSINTGWSNELTLTALLKRTVGSVTQGAAVQFSAKTVNGETIGAFRDVKNSSDENGQASAVFSPGLPNDGYTGEINLIGTTYDVNNNELRDTAKVILIESTVSVK